MQQGFKKNDLNGLNFLNYLNDSAGGIHGPGKKPR